MMKKSFLLTAIVLLSFLIPLTGWGQTYNLATSLSVGDEVVLVNTGVTKELGSITTSGTTYGTAVDVTNSTPAGTNQLTVVAGTSEGSFAFKTSGGKYLSWSSGNSLTTATSVTNASSWTVSFSEGVATIANVGTSDRKLRYNSSSPRFACYTTSQTAVKLYKKESGGSTAVATTTSIDASGITNTDVYTSTAAGSLSATVTETESGNAVSGATVTWTSSDEGVATIDENGVVTLVAAGTTTITASYAGVTDEFRASSDTYELTVTNSAPIIEITPNYEFWGQTAQFSGDTYDELSGEKDNVTLEWTRGSGSTYANTTAMRFYKDNTLTFTAPDGYEIKSIEISLSTTTTTSNDLTFSPDGYNSQTTTWTGSSATVTMSRPSNGTSYFTITKYTITLGEPSTDPIINASNTNIAYDATSGEIAYTITNPVTGKTLQATADADWVSNIEVGAEAITFTTTANEANTERVATFTLTYEGAEDKTVTVTQAASPVVYSTIPALFQAATSTVTDVNVQFNNWVVTGVSTNGRNVFVTDGTNGFAIYDGSGSLASTYAVGNTLAGLASCKLKLQNGYAQLQDVNAADLTIGTGGSVDFATITMADLAGINTGALVQYDNLTCSVDDSGTTPKYYLTDGTTTLQVYNTLYADALTTLEEGKVYNIKGVYQQYSKTKEILPRDANDIEEVIKPTITVDPSEVNVGYEAGNGTLTLTYENFEVTGASNFSVVSCHADGSVFTMFGDGDMSSWLTATVRATDTGYEVYYTVTKNTEATARTGYFKVVAGDKGSIGSNVVTVTQAAAPTYAVLPFSYNDGKSSIENTDGLSQEGLGSDYNVSNNPTTQLKFDGTGDWLLLQFDEEPGKLSFDIKGNSFLGSTFTVQTSEDGVTFTDLASYDNTKLGNGTTTQKEEFTNLGANVRFIKWIYTEKVSGNVGLGNIKLEKPANTVTVTIKANFPATTFSCDKALDFTSVEGITAYIITNDEGAVTEVTKVPAGKGLYIEATNTSDTEQTFDVPVITAEEAAEAETTFAATKLIPTASDGSKIHSEQTVAYYAYGKPANKPAAFYKISTDPAKGLTQEAGKALLKIEVANASSAKEMIMVNSDVTAIEDVNRETITNNHYYTVDGKCVKGEPTQKGIYIVKGRKVVVK